MGAFVVINDISDPHKQEFLRGHDEEICCLSVSPSGQLLASGQQPTTKRKGSESPIVVWDLEARRELYQLLGHVGGVSLVDFSPDERFLATTAQDCKLYIWDMQVTKSLPKHKIQREGEHLIGGVPLHSRKIPNDSCMFFSFCMHFFCIILFFKVLLAT